ncbi:MAG: 16S rRNA processing protein RimM [Clostridia bacterium]|nr:16S rRNA processing protein RimM [Clostridia bacterium]
MQTENKYLECGKIINTHGIKGAVKLESWCDSPETLADLEYIYLKSGNGFEKRRVISVTVMKRHVMTYIEGITDIDTAAAMKETVVYADRDDIPLDEGDYFISDLIGLPVFDVDSGIEYGKISEVFNTGASDIYTVKTEEGERMIPAVPEFIIEIDVERGVFVRPIEGMFN